eukprot:maker-scaffold428_size174301-snap-gene-0.24 protein:Tk03107 transcript:maker-scaffold428_size174301-snap-gene-0.24-mRNA-1 annotation:"PREDICTED: uncharacterized protein LOC101738478"
MLKHCNPSSTVDLAKRSSISHLPDHEDDHEEDHPMAGLSLDPGQHRVNNNMASSSAHSSSASSECSSLRSSSGSPSIHYSQHHGSTQTDLIIASLKDAATSPLCRARKIPLSSIIRHHYRQQRKAPPPPAHPHAAIFGSGFTPDTMRLHVNSRIPIKVYAKCLRSDIEYKTLSLSPQTTSKELIWMLLSKYKMRHRDPKLFYLTMDINIKRTGIPLQRSLALDDESRPVELKSCHPWGECKFTLQMRKGGVVRIYDSVLMAESKYKCLLISENTTADEVVEILFHCYGWDGEQSQTKWHINPKFSMKRYCIFEQNPSRTFERRLGSQERPVQVQSAWPNPSNCMLVLRLIQPTPSSSSPVQMLIEEEETLVDDVEDEENCARRQSNHLPPMSQSSSVFSPDRVSEDGGCVDELETSYASSAESTASSSEYSALRFRDSPASSSSRSTQSSADSGLIKSSPDFVPQYQKHRSSGKISNGARDLHQRSNPNPLCQLKPNTFKLVSRQISLHSLLETLPAASVDTGAMDAKSRKASLSSLSLDSRSSDFDSYFYI